MMSESSDDQPEIVTHEEAELAEKQMVEAAKSATPPRDPVPARMSSTSPPIAAPSPLPDFITSKKSSPSPLTVDQQRGPAPAVMPARQISPATATVPTLPVSITQEARITPEKQPAPTVAAPEMIQTPYEASSNIDVAPDSPSTSPAQTQKHNLFGFFDGGILQKVVQKTKTSMESVITTLDPGMREIIKSGGDINVVVTSTKESKVGGVRHAFQDIFGKATVTGKETQATMAAQPVGFTAGLKGAEERIQHLRRNNIVDESQPIVSIEGFIVEILPDRWYEMSCLILIDTAHRIELQMFSQPTPIPTIYVHQAQDETPKDYPLRWSGLAVTIGQVIEKSSSDISQTDWQNALTGVSRQQSLCQAAKTLAFMYKERLPS